MEFDEARRQGKRVLVYVKSGPKVQKQMDFVRKVEDFATGYIRRPLYMDSSELAEWVKEDVQRQLFEIVEAAEMHDGDAELAGSCLLALALTSLDVGEPDQATSLLERLVRGELGDTATQDRALERLVAIYVQHESWNNAIDACYQRVYIYEGVELDGLIPDASREKHQGTTGRRLDLARVLWLKAGWCEREGAWDEAVGCYERSANTYRSAGEQGVGESVMRDLGLMYGKAGGGCEDRGELDRAVGYYVRGIEVFRGLEDHLNCGELLHTVGLICLAQGRIYEAVDYFRASRAQQEKVQDYDGIISNADKLMELYRGNTSMARAARMLCVIGDDYSKAERKGKAEEALQESRRLSKEEGDHKTHAEASWLTAQLREREAEVYETQWHDYGREKARLAATEFFKDALRLLRDAADSFERSGDQSEARRVRNRVASLEQRVSNLEACPEPSTTAIVT